AGLATLLGRDPAAVQRLRWTEVAAETVAPTDPHQPALVDLRDAEGERHPALWYEASLPQTDPLGGGSVGVAVPRPARSAAAASLEEAETRFGIAIQNAPVGIALLDPRGSISYANAAFGRIAF